MALQGYKRLGKGTLGTSATTMYTVPTAKEAVVRRLSIVNTSTSTAVQFALFNGGSGGSDQITNAISLQPNEAWYSSEAYSLAAADTLVGIASVASLLTYNIMGIENA